MKFTIQIILALLILVNIQTFAQDLEPVCSLTKTAGVSERFDCKLGEKDFHILKLRGNFIQTVAAQASLMPQEILQGPIREAIDELQSAKAEGSLVARNLKSAIFECYSSRIRNSVSREFLDASDVFAKTMKQNTRSSYSRDDFRDAVYGVELSIAFEGLFRRMEDDKLGVMAELATTCGIHVSLETIGEVIGGIGNMGKMKMGCLGFTASANATMNDGLMHARNFDANLVESWNRHPTLFLVSEPGFYKYAAVASAGVVYPGGISGMNEHGISTSLHEMSSTHYRTFHFNRSADLAPMVQTRILREARTLDEAIAIVKGSEHFGGWTILVSDSKTNETASIEISGDKVQVARRRMNIPMGQSNHFLGTQMQDQFFTYSYGKKLESKSRLSVIEKSLQSSFGQIDIQWMIDHLASHEDAYEGRRAFGRTAVKAYNVMSTVAVPKRNEFWFSIGDQMPAAHSHFVGAAIDFSELDFKILGTKRTHQYENIPHWEKSLSIYVYARLAYEAKLYPLALRRLDEALSLAAQDGIDESTYRYIRARLLLEMGRPSEALIEFNHLWSIRDQLHRHKVALIALYSAASGRGLASDRTSIASGIFKSIRQNDEHFDLDKKIQLANEIQRNEPMHFEKIDFVTVE